MIFYHDTHSRSLSSGSALQFGKTLQCLTAITEFDIIEAVLAHLQATAL